MENQEWEQFKSEIKKQLLILPKSPNKDMHFEVSKATENYNKHGVVAQNTLLEVNRRLLDKPESFVRRQSTALIMAHYIWSYEGSYVLCIDEICSLLVINGHDLFDVVRKEYAASFEDVTNVDIPTKLKFLKAHNLKILDRTQDRKLRNKLAHNDFLLTDDGILRVDGVEVDILQRSTDLLNFATKIMNMLKECYDEATNELLGTS